MDQHISPDEGGASATATPGSSISEPRVNTINSEDSNSTRNNEDVLNGYGEGSNSNSNCNSGRNGNRNERTGTNVDDTGNQSDTYLSRRPQTLGDVMREPGSRAPDVMVLESMPEESTSRNKEAALNPKEDLWLSTADG